MTTTNAGGRARQGRRKIIIAFVVLGFLPVAVAVFLFAKWNIELANTFGTVTFEKELKVPQLAEATLSADGTRTFALELQAGQTEFFAGHQTNTWGINGSYLGPTLRIKRGEKVAATIRNSLPETTSIHWHGMHLPANMDGGPHQPIAPGATWSPQWTVNQPSATLWYHPHPHGTTKKHVYRGLSGMVIVDDDTPAQQQLPHTYGVDDIPAIIQDKKFTSGKQFSETEIASTGLTGKDILVNGIPTPHVTVSTEYVRLRLLNGSNARIYNLGLSNNQQMTLVATDGGLLEQPVSLQKLALSPGERAEILVRMQPGQRVNLRSYPLSISTNILDQRSNGGDDSLEIMQLRANSTLTSNVVIPETLTAIEKLDAGPSTTTRTFDLLGVSINGKQMDMQRVDFAATRDTTERWLVTNKADGPHNFHIHDVQFQVKSVNGAPPPVHLRGWKDTILLYPQSTAELVMRFTDYSDPKSPYMFHCHLLTHEDVGMMGQFVVVEPGQAAPQTIPPHTGRTDHAH